MKILALDTTHESGSLALLEDDQVIELVPMRGPDGFSVVLFAYIEELLSRHALKPADLGLFAAASGPGSFTGVRVGLTAVKAMAEATSRPCRGISNLAAMAEFSFAPLRIPLSDARRGEVYGGIYGSGLAIESVATLTELVASLPSGDREFLAFDYTAFVLTEPRMTVIPRELAAHVGHLALRQFRSGFPCDPATVDANYVRRSDAEKMWVEAR